jgi:hypothetical protein
MARGEVARTTRETKREIPSLFNTLMKGPKLDLDLSQARLCGQPTP